MQVMENIERIVPVSALQDNYIWAICGNAQCVVVDPGEAAPVQAFLKEQGLKLAAILLTHRHADHQGGVPALLDQVPVPVFGPSARSMSTVTRPLQDGESFLLEGFSAPFSILTVPGHTEEHIAYLHAGSLFCGDTLFAAGCGRLLGGTAAQLHASLERLAALPSETGVHCAHEYTLANLKFAQAVEPGNTALQARRQRCETLRAQGLPTLPSRLEEELATNPFLRCAQAEVRHAAEAHAGRKLSNALEVFTELRKWKDGF